MPKEEAVRGSDARHLPLPLWQAAVQRPEHQALEWEGRRWSYAELAAEADLAAAWLAQTVEEGDRVGLVAHARPETVVFVHAVARLGAVLVPIDPRLTASERRAIETDAEPALVIDETPPLGTGPPGGGRLRSVASGERLEAVASGEWVQSVASDRPWAIVYTSGTSGESKGVVLSHGNMAWSAAASALRLGHLPGDRWLCTLPLHHMGGLALLMRCATYATTVVLHSGFDARRVAQALGWRTAGHLEAGVTLASLVPTMLRRVMEVGIEPGPQLRAILLGGAAADDALLDTASSAGYPIALTYGLTEAASQVATRYPSRERSGRGAPPLAWTSVAIGEPDADGVGEVLVRGPTVMSGYWRRPELTARTLRDGALHTGDRGWLSVTGELHVVGRADRTIVTGGENVDPSEVEATLMSHPGVREAAVVGLPDGDWGEVVAAAVTLQPGVEPADLAAAGALDDSPEPGDQPAHGETDNLVPGEPGYRFASELLREHCRKRLAGYKVPKTIAIVESMPLTGSGKVSFAEVRRLLSRG